MKTIRLSAIGAFATILLFASCQRSSRQDVIDANNFSRTTPVQTTGNGEGPSAGKQKPNTGECNPYAYTVTLESHTVVNGNWEWIWSVQNPNPGNGGNGTVQDLSHWGMQFGTCFNWSSVVSAAFSPDGSNWTSFSPSMHVDPSQGCMTTPVLKFDFGTTGSNKSYYKLVVNSNYLAGMIPGYYKSGANTGCCTFLFDGIGCLSQEPPGER